MHRIDTPTAQKDKFGAGKNGFTRGNPQTGTPATDLDDDYFDMLQEELAGIIEATGIVLDKSKHDQLRTALPLFIGMGVGAPPIGIPFFWPSIALPNAVMPEWSSMVFLKWNGATFSATTYPKLALVIPSLTLTEARGEFPRILDDGRGVDSGRALLSAQGDAIRNITGGFKVAGGTGTIDTCSGVFTQDTSNKNTLVSSALTSGTSGLASFNASNVVPTASENRPRNIAFNFLVRAK